MAKRINKKVAFIGLVAVIFIAIGFMVVLFKLNRDPNKFIEDASAAYSSALEEQDPDVKTELFDKADRAYKNAYNSAKKDSLKIDILFRLVDLYKDMNSWNKVMGCWRKITDINPEHIEANFDILKYLYILADSGSDGLWSEILQKSSDMIEVVEEKGLSQQKIADYDPFPDIGKPNVKNLGDFLYLIRARAYFKASKTTTVSPEDVLDNAQADIQKVIDSDNANVEAYQILSEIYLAKANIERHRGNNAQVEQYKEAVNNLIRDCLKYADDNPRAHTYGLYSRMSINQNFEPDMSSDDKVEKFKSFEKEFVSFTQRFSDSAEAFASLASYYSKLDILPAREVDDNGQVHLFDKRANLEKTIKAIDQAVKLDSDNVGYMLFAAQSYHRRYSIYADSETQFKKDIATAIKLAEDALQLPDAQDTAGPLTITRRTNRFAILTFLAERYTEQILDKPDELTDQQIQQYTANLEQTVHDIEQLVGSGDDPVVIKWKGMLELVRGNNVFALKYLYSVYEQLSVAGNTDTFLAYRLSRYLRNTSEIGAVTRYLSSSIYKVRDGIPLFTPNTIVKTNPKAILEYAELLISQGRWAASEYPVSFDQAIGSYEYYFGADKSSRQLYIRALISEKPDDISAIEEEIEKADFESHTKNLLEISLTEAKIFSLQRRLEKINQTELQARLRDVEQADSNDIESNQSKEDLSQELQQIQLKLSGLVEKAVNDYHEEVELGSVLSVCRYYKKREKKDQMMNLIDRYVKANPGNDVARLNMKIFAEPDISKIPTDRFKELQEESIAEITDPFKRLIGLGIFYSNQKDRLSDAKEQFEAVLQQTSAQSTDDIEKDARRIAVSGLLELAIKEDVNDIQLAKEMAQIAVAEDIDCQGLPDESIEPGDIEKLCDTSLQQI